MRIAAISLIVVILGPTIFIFQLRTKHWKLHIWFCKLQLGQKVILDLIGKMLGPFYWGWWIAWSPFVGMFIAHFKRAYCS
jgi:choline-glycine betaine transporter